MRQVTDYELHPLCEMFPAMNDADLRTLADDIKANGLQEPIVLFKGKILDGRNRHRACILSGQPIFTCDAADLDAIETFDPVAFVLSKNLHRRHLDTSQRAMVANRLAQLRHGQHADVNKFTSSQSNAADMLSVCRKSVINARTVSEQGSPEIASAVDAGAIPVTTAAEFVKAIPDKAKQAEIVAKGPEAVKEAAKAAKAAKTPKPAPKPPESQPAIENDHCTVTGEHRWKDDDGDEFCEVCLEPRPATEKVAGTFIIKQMLELGGKLQHAQRLAFLEAFCNRFNLTPINEP